MWFKIMFAKLVLANRELRGVRTVLIRLVSATIAFFLSVVGIVLILAGWNILGQVVILITTGLLSATIGLSAIKTLRTIMPILQRKR